MEDYKNMSDRELKVWMLEIKDQLSTLMDDICECIDGRKSQSKVESIKSRYAFLKDEVSEVAHYVKLGRNYEGSRFYMGVFSPGVREASAFGFMERKGCSNMRKLLSAVEEARYKMGKYLN